jgi:hypothetical protein
MTHNFDRSSSARFSFLMSIPVMLGAGLVSLKDLAAVPDLAAFLPILLVGFIAALIVGYLSIHWLLSFIRRRRLWYFALYCIVLAGIVLTVADIRASNVQASSPTAATTASTLSVAVTLAAASPEAASGLQIINLEYSNSLDWLTSAMTSCANLIQDTGLVTHSLPADSLNLQNADLLLRWGAPSSLTQSAYQIGTERLALAVKAQNPLHSLPLDVARQVFSGDISTWGALHTACPDCFNSTYDSSLDAKSISLNFYPADTDVQQLFIQLVMAGQPVASGSALLIPDPAAMRETLSNSPTALGFLPAHALDANLSEVSLTGVDSATLNQPVLLLPKVTPQGKTLDWVTCLEQVLKP